jgi:hypothetical protein
MWWHFRELQFPAKFFLPRNRNHVELHGLKLRANGRASAIVLQPTDGAWGV